MSRKALMEHDSLRILMRSGEPALLRLARGTQSWQGSPPARASANSPETLIHLARPGLGITMLSDHFAYKLVQSGELVQVLGDWQIAPVNAWAVFPGRRLMPARARVFLDALQAEFSGPGCEKVEAEIGEHRGRVGKLNKVGKAV